ncbi:Fic family protein [Desulfuromonas thiophila]|uniref:Fic family protein n=1 Tax=Desulfuromonas thiophila TaxID=57664 RepID=UPI0024A847AC|nr:Fic family protein [Desulfuromonas thiophila]
MKIENTNIQMVQESLVPRESRLAGWAALGTALSIEAPLRHLSCVSEKFVRGSRKSEREWTVFDKRYWPGETFADHLTFALRHEPLDLLLLVKILRVAPRDLITDYVRNAPSGQPNRRIWFLYEHLTGQTLDLPDAEQIAAIDLLDPKDYVTGQPALSKRHRVRNNLLGVPGFCPVIRRTQRLEAFMAAGLDKQARQTIGRTGGHLVARAASFLLLADSRASFAIEGERPPRSRLERWGRAVMQAGRHPLTLDELLRLHAILIEDTRFIHAGLRPDGVFLGERDHTGEPLPEFIGARPEDLPALMQKLIEANDRMRRDGIDAILQAAATAFGFVYIHPFQDGNGRVHRCIIHHVLAERNFTPAGMVFPVSAVMLDRIGAYRKTLQLHTAPIMPFIDWMATPAGNVMVLNETKDFYRYFDCTESAEFLYECVQRTVNQDLPREIEYLRRHDEAIQKVMDTVEMPDNLADNLVLMILQNNGKLAKRRRQKEFEALTDAEVSALEQIVQSVFEGFAENSCSGTNPDAVPC